MRLFVRLSLVGLILLVALGFWINSTSPKETAKFNPVTTSGMCEGAGVSIVIDFGTASNETSIEKCIENFAGNSWNMMAAAGIKVEGTSKYPVGFVCRINGVPDKSQERCIETPGIDKGTWAFYLVDSGKWEYSAYGASSHKTKCGTSEGWRFLLPGELTTTVPRTTPVNRNCEK